ncbi:MAG TPA: hypothetical protein VGA73_19555 [Candidatus Binatia bacterium]
MNYFRPYSFPAEPAVFAAWDSQVATARETPWLEELLAEAGSGLFPLFAARYAEISALPRRARRALQRRLARSRELALPPERRRQLAGSLAGAALLLALGQGTALANTITVNTAAHGVKSDGKCSLVEAIDNANDTGTGQPHADCAAGDTDQNNIDTIILAKKTFTLTSSSGSFYGSDTGLPLITSKVTIQGNGAKIVRKKGAPSFRHFAVAGNGSIDQLRLYGLTLGGGYSNSHGGSIVNYGRLYIYDSVITGNGAGGYGGGLDTVEGRLRVHDTIISKNFSYRSGGGIGNFHADARIYNSTITGNAAYNGGGVQNFQAGLRIYDSIISFNAAYGDDQSAGGGIHNEDAGAFVYDSLITGNYASYEGGGINNFDGYLKVDPTTISNNTAPLGGGIANRDGSTARLNNTTITGNKAELGGGIFNVNGATAYVGNSTITKNTAFGPGGGVYNDAWFVMEDSSVTKNKASSGGGGIHNNGTFVDNGGDLINGNKPTDLGS